MKRKEELAGIVLSTCTHRRGGGEIFEAHKEKEEIPSPVCTCEVVCTEEEEKGRWFKHYEEEKESDPLVCEVVLPEEEEEEGWLKHYSSKQSILLVGEGDFSFSASLQRNLVLQLTLWLHLSIQESKQF
ncbi:unnamed protein product [Thlaspi arvense]|uniref:25S rRNA (uridine-N(3))-methyltransferase BMT5-like domain-containing protein n=1 Tax=Thlaspi arvense TaxID=13288 RepID=A0AAU9RT02_THLAR|nr:unnamed protein product [Thlaspi arvense]